MSPASQGNLEVERYIGSCLISSSVRVSNTSGKINNSNNNVNYKGKKVADCGGPRPGKLHTGVLNHRGNGSSGVGGGGGGNSANSGVVGNCQDHHFSHITAGYPSPGSLLPLCECGGLKFGGARYGSPGPNAGVGAGWAGLPLISMAPSNSRRNRKPSTSSNGSLNSGNRHVKNSTGPHPGAVVTNGSSGKNSVDVDHGSQQSRTPLSRLAIHTQGAPLILAGRYNINGRKNNVNHNRGPPARQIRAGDISVRRSNSVRDTRDTAGSGGSANGSNGGTPSSDCLSVASDESSGHSENSLPRIIKPRKRRKKDRKPPPQANASPPETPNTTTPNELKSPSLESPSIVTLKPYIPVCYELYDSGRWNGVHRNINKEETERRIKILEVENKHSFRPPYAIEVPRDDEQVSQASEEDNQEPKLHHNFDDVEEDDEGLHAESGTLFPYPCPPTLCQCRYCDPSGLIWDVDQHCYSPFLTPPSPTANNISPSYSKSPFANIPLFLTPPPTEVRSFDFLSKDTKSSQSSVFLSDSDHSSSLLRRSWSEPLPSTLRSGSVVSRDQDLHGNFGAIGRGKSRNDENESRSSSIHDPQNAINEVPSSNVTVSTSQSLEVSTEIVTSPNGHRDIEIKFYSSSPPAGAAVMSSIEIKNGPEDGNCEERNSDNSRISPPPPQSENLDRQEVISVWDHNEGSACAMEGNVKKYIPSQESVDNSLCSGEVLCNISEKGFCEQSAKKLGEGVNQLHLHAEE